MRQKLSEPDSIRMEEIAQMEESDLVQRLDFAPNDVGIKRGRNVGHFAFVAMFLNGLAVVSLYGLLSKATGFSSLAGFLPIEGINAIFENLARLITIALVALLAGFGFDAGADGWVSLCAESSRFEGSRVRQGRDFTGPPVSFLTVGYMAVKKTSVRV